MLAPPPMGNPGSTLAVADLGGTQHTPPMAQNFLDFMQFFGKFNKIVCWCPLEGRCPLLQGIQDPPPC